MKKVISLSLAIISLLIIVYIYYDYVINNCSGIFIYGLDDSYIHLSLAKNFVENGNLGINSDVFGFATSSPLWTTILMIIFKLIGYNELVPFYLNIIIAILIILFSFKIAEEYIKSQSIHLNLLIFVIITIPIVPMIFIGMEHLLHLLLSLLFIYITLKLKHKSDSGAKSYVFLAIVTFLLSLVRYESFFLILGSSLIMLRQKYRLKFLLIVVIFSIIPHILIGIYSINSGGLFFPNPVLLKSYDTELSFISFFQRYVYSGIINLVENTPLLVSILLCSALLIFLQLGKSNIYSTQDVRSDSMGVSIKLIDNPKYIIDLISIFLITALLHLQLSKTGWFYRYEAYLVGLFLIFLLPIILRTFIYFSKKSELKQSGKTKLMLLACSLVLIAPFIHRGVESHNRLRFAPVNIYEQQYHISKFLDGYYKDTAVGINDIGIPSLMTKVKIIDVFGLADNNITKAKLDGSYSPNFFYNYLLSKNCKILVIFESWFKKEIKYSINLIRVATWKIENNVVCGMDEVTFYALDPQSAELLKTSLQNYREKIPKTVNLRILI